MNDHAAASFGAAGHTSILDAQVASLLQRITNTSDARCRELRAVAEMQARELLRSAREEARRNVHQAVAQERSRIQQGLRQAEANAAMQERLHAEQSIQRLLTEMWQVLPEMLRARWRDFNHRREWIQAAARQAISVLSNREWRVEHGADIPAAECRNLIEQTFRGDALGRARTLALVADSSIAEGVRIRAGNACLDATISGLLTSRVDIEAAFLAEYTALSPALAEQRP